MFGISGRFCLQLLTIILLLLVSLTAKSTLCPECNGNMFPGKDGEYCENGCEQKNKNDANCASFSQRFGDELELYLRFNPLINEGIREAIQLLATNARWLGNNPPSPDQLSNNMREMLQQFQAKRESMQSLFSRSVWQRLTSRERCVSTAPILSQEALAEILALFEIIRPDHHLNTGFLQVVLLTVLISQQESYGDSAVAGGTSALSRLDLQVSLLSRLIELDDGLRASQAVVLGILRGMSEVASIETGESIAMKARQISMCKTYDASEADMADHFLANSHSNYHVFSLKAPGFLSFGLRAVNGDTQSIFLTSPMIRISVNTNDLPWLIRRLQNFLNPATLTGILYDATANILGGLDDATANVRGDLDRLLNENKKLVVVVSALMLIAVHYKHN